MSPDTNRLTLAPYYHPTTICIVDDNEPFLASLELELPGEWACVTFSDPEEALEFLHQPITLAPLMDRCFSLQLQSGQAVIRLDLGMIEQEISHVDRFRRNSVLVIDYAMPSLNGMQFCEALQDRGILAKETHHTVIRFAPPLVIDRATLEEAMPHIEAVLRGEDF